MIKIKHSTGITRLVCLVIFFCLPSLVIHSQSFNVVGCKAENETTGFGIYNNKLLYSYGDLNMCGVAINGFGVWNSVNWIAFPQGGNINNPFAFEIFQGSLYAGGAFLTIGGKTTNKIARWNGIHWDSVGKGLDGQLNTEKINALAVYKNELYVAGRFRQVDGVSGYQQIAVWNGTSWRKIAGLQGSILWVECMAVYKGELYVGGVFAKAGSTNASFIARWNGQEWKSVGKGTNGLVLAMVVDTLRDLLYVTGDFNSVQDTIKCRVASWDGTTWTAIGNDSIFPTNVNALEMYHGYLYGGGAQRYVQQKETLLARWDGNTWEPIPSFNGYIGSLKTYNDELYIGGGFTKINSDSIPYLARYYSPDSVLIGINSKEKFKKVLDVYPNPVESILYIKSDLNFRKIIILNAQGKKVDEFLDKKINKIDISKLANGTYFIKAFTEEKDVYSAKFVKR